MILIRHAEPVEANVITGQMDPPLIPSLRHKRMKNLHNFPDDMIVISSPLRRARETASLFGYADPQIDDRIVEMDLGEFQGIAATDENLLKLHNLADNPESIDHGGESFKSFYNRVHSFYNEYKDKDVLVFTHAGVIRILLVSILQLEDESFNPGYLDIITIDGDHHRGYDHTQVLISRS